MKKYQKIYIFMVFDSISGVKTRKTATILADGGGSFY